MNNNTVISKETTQCMQDLISVLAVMLTNNRNTVQIKNIQRSMWRMRKENIKLCSPMSVAIKQRKMSSTLVLIKKLHY